MDWEQDRDRWVQHVKAQRLQAVIAAVAAEGVDSGGGVGRLRAIRWLATRGRFGSEGGWCQAAAREHGAWTG